MGERRRGLQGAETENFFWIGKPPAGDHFEGDHVPQPAMPGFENDPHPAATQFVEQIVFAQGCWAPSICRPPVTSGVCSPGRQSRVISE